MLEILEPLRVELGERIRRTLAGERPGSGAPAGAAGDIGLFGPGSATWEVHADPALLVGGLRALLVQTLHPLAMAGVADHSTYRTDPLGRLHRTAAFVATTTFGSTVDADAAIERVRRVHARVTGYAPDGRRYRADDPHLLGWVHATEVHSFLRAHQRYGARPLAPGDDDRYVAEMASVGRRLGVVDPPRDVASLRATLQAYRPELVAGEQAREAVRFLVWPPLPLTTRVPYGVVLAAAVALLPPFARRLLRLPLAPLAEPVAIAPATTVLLRLMGWALGPHPAHHRRHERALRDRLDPPRRGADGR